VSALKNSCPLDFFQFFLVNHNFFDGLTDLRTAIEFFLFDLITKIGDTPRSQDKVAANITKLQQLGYLNGQMEGLLTQTLVNGVWVKLLDDAVHGRKSFSLFDSRFFFNLSEDTFDFLIEKVLRYNIKSS